MWLLWFTISSAILSLTLLSDDCLCIIIAHSAQHQSASHVSQMVVVNWHLRLQLRLIDQMHADESAVVERFHKLRYMHVKSMPCLYMLRSIRCFQTSRHWWPSLCQLTQFCTSNYKSMLNIISSGLVGQGPTEYALYLIHRQSDT